MDKSNEEWFQLPREQLEARLKWYSKKFGPVIQTKGLHNWKNLFKKPNFYEWTILFMVIMALFIAWAYMYDINGCKELVNELQTELQKYNIGYEYNPQGLILPDNYTIKEVVGEGDT